MKFGDRSQSRISKHHAQGKVTRLYHLSRYNLNPCLSVVNTKFLYKVFTMSKIQITLIQLANHYHDYNLGLTGEPLSKDKLKQIKKIHRLERNPRGYSLEDYAISLVDVPDHLIELMKAIGWLSEGLSIPMNDKGFYYEKWNPENSLPVGAALIRYFIPFDKYVELLTIAHNLDNIGV